MDYYTVHGEIAKGYFGSSYRVREKHNKKRFRTMQMIKFSSEDKAKAALSTIQSLFSVPKHDHICRYRDAFFHYQHGAHFANAVLEVCISTNLNDYVLRRYNDLDDDCLKGFMLQLIDALSFLHQRKLFHNALTPHNVLVGYDKKNELCLKLANFGLSTVYQNDHKSFTMYCPPELTPGTEPKVTGKHGDKCDIFSLGILFCAMLEFRTLDADDQNDKVLAAYVQFPGYGLIPVGKFLRENPSVDLDRHLFSKTSTDVRHIVRQMLTAAAPHRPSAKSVRKHLVSCLGVRFGNHHESSTSTAKRTVRSKSRKRGREVLGEDFSCLNTPMKKPRARVPSSSTQKPNGLIGYLGAMATAAGVYWGLKKENSSSVS
ncbi:serine/threonine-protein kinase pdik1l-B-like [Ptychodera flava]|uniref:serine/threonine-protein kinase pdik1l-B-like n=1 Tax=Ptychodera flava TaxID=63121 RepID=UPI003969BC0E